MVTTPSVNFRLTAERGFRVRRIKPNQIRRRKRRILRRLEQSSPVDRGRPMIQAGNLHYELAEKASGTAYGGIAAIHRFAEKIGLPEQIDQRLDLFKIHQPFHESDHVLNFAYNALCGGTCLQDIELRRNDESFLDALGTDRIPDPTTAGDFCRRFKLSDINALQDAIDEVRLGVWKSQGTEFFKEATIEMDGTIVETTGQCKVGMDMSYKGIWGYHPLVLTLAQTGELLAEIRYRPEACKRDYRLVIIRKNLKRNDKQGRFFDDYRYFFYLSNDWGLCIEEVVYGSNDRCNQENILAQLNEARALHAPVDTLESNWAYMVMTAQAWNLKAWVGLSIPVSGRWQDQHHAEKSIVVRMEFKKFVEHFVRLPCQVIQGGRRILIRLLSWNEHLHIFNRWLGMALE